IMDSVTEIHMRFVYAKVSSSGVAMARLVEKRRQFLAALGERNVATATRLMRTHLESVQRMLEQDPGAMSLHVALAEVQPGMRRQPEWLDPRSNKYNNGGKCVPIRQIRMPDGRGRGKGRDGDLEPAASTQRH